MAKSKKKNSKATASKQKKNEENNNKKKKNAPKISLQEIDAMSVDSNDNDGSTSSEDWNAEALALRKSIEEGAFNHLLVEAEQKDSDDDDDELEEVELGADDDETNEKEAVKEAPEEVEDDEEMSEDDDEDDEEKSERNPQSTSTKGTVTAEIESDEGDSDDDSSSSSDEEQTMRPDLGNGKALMLVTQELVKAKRNMPWPETFDVVVSEPLPFGATPEASGTPLDVHDDLKRELAFYNHALLAAQHGRRNCKQGNVPFSRPVDFFAEMVKTDDHMARVKDRLIFETKKMDAVSQRKSNKEHKLRAKEAHANKVAEKARRKKEHFTSIQEWKEENADSNNERRLPNKKREAANRKFGFGGKRGRFKQNSKESMNDMTDYNPRGNFSGGRKAVPKKRPGKRARDSARSRR